MAERTQSTAVRRAQRKTMVGCVTSNRMTKTIVVSVKRRTQHSQYPRTVTQVASFKVHDERNEAKIGDLVEIMETRPISREKRWRLVKILEHASTAPPVPGEPSEEVASEAGEGAGPAGGSGEVGG